MNLYKILGVKQEDDATIIKRKYRDLARQLHPDKNPGDKNKEKKFKEVAAAYSILGNEERRALYDRELAENHDGASIFGLDFDELVNQIKTEGIKAANLDGIVDEFFRVSRKIYEDIPKKTRDGLQDPENFLQSVGDLLHHLGNPLHQKKK